MAKPTSKDAVSKDVSQQKSDKPSAAALNDDDLQDVTGGVMVPHPTGPVTTGPFGPTGPIGPTGPTTGPTIPVCIID
jgi:hypothetical protein